LLLFKYNNNIFSKTFKNMSIDNSNLAFNIAPEEIDNEEAEKAARQERARNLRLSFDHGHDVSKRKEKVSDIAEDSAAKRMRGREKAAEERAGAEEKSLQEARAELETRGLVERDVEGKTIFNLENIKNLRELDLQKGKIASFINRFCDGRSTDALVRIYKGLKGVSREDYDNGEREEKDLLYVPKSEEDALDIKKIKESRFYLTPRDVIASGIKKEDVRYGGLENLNFYEIIIPLYIYHPDFGDGFRNSSGKLEMFDKRKKKYAHFTGEAFDNNFCRINYGEFHNVFGRGFIEKYLPALTEKELLLPTDVKGSLEHEDLIDVKNIRTRGQVMFEGVHHVLGAEFEGDEAYRMDNKTGFIVKRDKKLGEREISHQFKIVKPEEARETKGGYKSAGVKEAGVKDFNKEKYLEKREGETEDQYRERVERFSAFSLNLELDNLFKKFGLQVGTLDFNDQKIIAEAMRGVDFTQKLRLVSLVKKGGKDSIISFLSAIDKPEMAEKIYSIGEFLDGQTAKGIFRHYANIIRLRSSLIDSAEESLNHKLSTEERKNISDNILKKANCFLEGISNKIGAGEKIDRQDIEKSFNEYNDEVILTQSVYKAMRGDLSLEEIKSVSFGEESASRYGDDQGVVFALRRFKRGGKMEPQDSNERINEAAQMLRMYENNWRAYDANFSEVLFDGFIDKLKNGGEATRIYNYKKDDRIMAFLRIDDVAPGKKYFGSFNALDSVKGGNIGETLLSQVLEKEGRDSDIEAVVAPQEDVLGWYINKHGFVGKGIDLDYHGTGQPMVEIERLKEQHEHYFSNYDNSLIIKEYEEKFQGNKYQADDNKIILKFSVLKDERNSRQDDTALMNQEIRRATEEKGLIITKSATVINGDKKDVFLCFEPSGI
jgi:hypothetical protein